MTSNRLTILAIGGAFDAGAFGTAAMGDERRNDGVDFRRLSLRKPTLGKR